MRKRVFSQAIETASDNSDELSLASKRPTFVRVNAVSSKSSSSPSSRLSTLSLISDSSTSTSSTLPMPPIKCEPCVERYYQRLIRDRDAWVCEQNKRMPRNQKQGSIINMMVQQRDVTDVHEVEIQQLDNLIERMRPLLHMDTRCGADAHMVGAFVSAEIPAIADSKEPVMIAHVDRFSPKSASACLKHIKQHILQSYMTYRHPHSAHEPHELGQLTATPLIDADGPVNKGTNSNSNTATTTSTSTPNIDTNAGNWVQTQVFPKLLEKYHYRVEQLIGHGIYGCVFRVRQVHTGVEYAMKVITVPRKMSTLRETLHHHDAPSSWRASELNTLRKEIRIQQKVASVNVAPSIHQLCEISFPWVIEIGVYNQPKQPTGGMRHRVHVLVDLHCVVMDLLHTTVHEWLSIELRSLSVLKGLADDMVELLGRVCKVGITHGDCHTQNIGMLIPQTWRSISETSIDTPTPLPRLPQSQPRLTSTTAPISSASLTPAQTLALKTQTQTQTPQHIGRLLFIDYGLSTDQLCDPILDWFQLLATLVPQAQLSTCHNTNRTRLRHLIAKRCIEWIRTEKPVSVLASAVAPEQLIQMINCTCTREQATDIWTALHNEKLRLLHSGFRYGDTTSTITPLRKHMMSRVYSQEFQLAQLVSLPVSTTTSSTNSTITVS